MHCWKLLCMTAAGVWWRKVTNRLLICIYKMQLFRNGWIDKWPNSAVHSLWLRDAIWRHIYGSTLAQVMACCLTAPSGSHNLNQCWLIISEVQWNSTSHDIPQPLITKIILLKFLSNLPGSKESRCKRILSIEMRSLCRAVGIGHRNPLYTQRIAKPALHYHIDA